MRATLLPGLFAAVARNIGRGLTDVALFEMGPVFRHPSRVGAPALRAGARPLTAELLSLDAALPDQPGRVAVVLAGAREQPGWWGKGRAAIWADAVEAARSLARAVGAEADVRADSARAVSSRPVRRAHHRRGAARSCWRAAPGCHRGIRTAGADVRDGAFARRPDRRGSRCHGGSARLRPPTRRPPWTSR